MSLNISQKFEEAAAKIKKTKVQLSDEQKLDIYGLYKQSTVGDVGDVPRPDGWFDMVGKAKWDAWKQNEGLTKEEAKSKYTVLVNSIIEN